MSEPLPVFRNTGGSHEPVSIIAELRSDTVTHCRRRERASSYRSLRRIRRTSRDRSDRRGLVARCRTTHRSWRSPETCGSSTVPEKIRFSRPWVSFVISPRSSIEESSRLTFAFDQPVLSTIRDCFMRPPFETSSRRTTSSSVSSVPAGMGGSSGNAPASERSDETGGGWNVGGVRSRPLPSGDRRRATTSPATAPPRRPTSSASAQSALGADWIAVSPDTPAKPPFRRRGGTVRRSTGRSSAHRVAVATIVGSARVRAESTVVTVRHRPPSPPSRPHTPA